MTDNTQPEALRLAELLTADEWPGNMTLVSYARECVAELRRQHARIAELEAQLEAIRAGGVSGPLMGKPQAMPDLTTLTERGAKAWAGVDAQALRAGGADMSKEREAFESWIKKDCGDLSTFGSGAHQHYRNSAVNNAWIAWQARASLAASAGSEPVAVDGWLHENGLLYRLTDERHPCNRDEINVTMADGSRSIESRSRRALELLDRIRAARPSPPEGMAGGWMPIERARASEWDQENWVVVYCVPGDYQPASKKPVQLVACYRKSLLGGKPYWSTEHGVIDTCVHRPTHFRPLHAPPTLSADSRKGE